MGSSSDSDDAADVLGDYPKFLIRVKARRLCRRPGISRSDEEDFSQDFAMQWLRKSPRYDAGRGASKNTYADRVVRSAANEELRSRSCGKRSPGRPVQSLESDTVEGDGGKGVPLGETVQHANLARRTGASAEDAFEAIDVAEAVSHVLGMLPPDLAEVVRCYMREGTVAAVARRMGVSRGRVRWAMKRFRAQFEEC